MHGSNKQLQSKYNTSQKVVVIGGGISGLATAALLAKQGKDVVLLEKNSTLGGRARVFKKKGYSFDMGPSWYMMPEVFEHFFAQFGKKPSDFFQLVRLNPRYKVVFEGQASVLLTDNVSKNRELFETIEKGSGNKLSEYLKKSQKAYDSVQYLLYQDIWNWKSWLSYKTIFSLSILISQIPLWQNWYSLLSKNFSDGRLKKILAFPAVFLGGSPFNTPSMYSILSWADFGKGIWYPMGGMAVLVEALKKLATDQGVKIVLNAEVDAITIKNDAVVSVKAAGKKYNSTIIVAATDIPFIETKLLDAKYRSWSKEAWEKKTVGISALLLYLGVNKRIKNITHHTLYFSEDWKHNFYEIFSKKKIPKEPSFYISARSVTDRSIVPKKSEEIVVLVPLGSGEKYSHKQISELSDRVIHRIEQITNTSIKDNLVVKEIYTPENFATDYNAYQGTALGLAHTFGQSLWLRPKNRNKKVAGLYYTGQYTNPGVGMPMVLISAEIVATMIDQTERANTSIFKNGSVTYYNSSLFFNGQVKKDVFALYAFVRVMDDFVDIEKPLVTELEQMQTATRIEWKGGVSKNRVVHQFIELAKRKNFKWSWIEAFMKAMKSDLYKKKYNSFEELETYMYGSAEVIGLMMARILDLPEESAKAAGLQGKAMQYINFIRDVREDESLGRNYLGYTKEQRENPDQWSSFIRLCIQRYKKIQHEAEKGYPLIPKRYLVPIKTASDMYSWTAEKIYADPERVWKDTIKPAKWRVLLQVAINSITLT